MEYYDMTNTFDELYARSKNGEKFPNLMKIISSDNNIKLAYRNIKRNTGSKTAGTDKLTIEDLEKLTAEEFIATVKKKLNWYKPKMVKRVDIPKPGSDKKRPLGIPCIWDRIIQQCILQVLEPICEAKFNNNSYGFRPNRSAENAMAVCAFNIQQRGLYYVVDIDIKGFFDNVNHSKLIRQMWTMGIRDKKLICIIKQMLKAPIKLPDKSIVYPQKGTPQGGILSPLLSNIVLNELDWWIASQWETFPTKHEYTTKFKSRPTRSNCGSRNRALKTTKLKEVHMVRYADDFKIFCRTYNEARRTFIAVKSWLATRLKLEISEEKSKIVNLRKGYSTYLGFKIKASRKKNKYVAISHMSDKAQKQVKEKLYKQIDCMAHPNNDKDRYRQTAKYNAMVIGIHNYYGIATRISSDLGSMGFHIHKRLKNKLQNDYHKINLDRNYRGYIWKTYGMSKMLKMVGETLLVPVGYIKTKNAMNKKKSINKYTAEGRMEIHKSLQLNMSIVLRLMREINVNKSIEYMDNRVSLYCAQRGKCAILGTELEMNDFHCHHKIPIYAGGTDRYNNLVIVHKDMHILIHATSIETIMRYVRKYNLTQHQIDKINKLREKLSLEEISK